MQKKEKAIAMKFSVKKTTTYISLLKKDSIGGFLQNRYS